MRPGTSSRDELTAQVSKLSAERDEYKKLYLSMLEQCRRLEQGLLGQKRERFVGAEGQQTLEELLRLVVPGAATPVETPTATVVPAHVRAKPTGRKPLPEHLPRIEVEVVPDEVQRQGLDAFTRIGQDVSEVVERRISSLVVVRTVRPKFVAKPKIIESVDPGPRVAQAPQSDLPIPRGMAGPALLAESIVHRFQDHLPLYRLEQIYARDGLELARSTICDWHFHIAELVGPVVEAMWTDARSSSPYLCMDATGVLVQEKERCRRGHFFVVISPGKHVLYGYSPKHNGAAVDALLGSYRGPLVVDAHSVYEHLFNEEKATEVACWAHARRYFFKALQTEGARARRGLEIIQALFKVEREYETAPPGERLQRRQREARPIVEAFFAYCDAEALTALDETPLAKAVNYARNQRAALHRFLEDGRLPIHNNASENALRREAVGRKNWLFLGSDDGGEVNATLVTLLASCQMHRLEPLGYLRDLLCLLPWWPKSRVLELAPAHWAQTVARPDVQAKLAANVYRQAALGIIEPPRP